MLYILTGAKDEKLDNLYKIQSDPENRIMHRS